MKVVITGANGFLAGYLIKELEKKNMTPVLLTRQEGSRYGYSYIATDYSFDSVNTIFAGNGIDAVVHLAAPRKVAETISFYSDYFDMTTNLYEAAFRNGVKNIICASSISVYSGDFLPYEESDIPVPGNMYGLSKVVAEQLGNIFNAAKQMKIKNLRFAHLYGANEQNNYMINCFFRQAYMHETLLVYGRSLAKREMMYAKDAASAILHALAHSDVSGTFNAGSGDALSNEEIAEIICSVMSPELRIKVGDEQENIPSSYMNNSLIYHELGFKAKYTLKTALPEIYQDMRLK